jgi:DMSO/TMAO reductase YedYZ molybdopterin-dependent catalytic subunit
VSTTRVRDGFSGAAATALALGISELAAGLFGSLPSLVTGLGNWVIDIVPPQVKDWAISTFGTNDKLALAIGIAIVAILIGAAVGVVARGRFGIAVVVFISFGVLAALATATDPQVSLTLAIIPGGLAALTGLATLQWLYGLGMGDQTGGEEQPADGMSRRSVVLGIGAVMGMAALSAGFGRVLLEKGKRSAAGRADVVLPAADDPVAAPGARASFDVPELSPIVTPNADFYRIDTAFSVPRVDIQDWTLSITGMVDRPYTLTYYDILDMDLEEKYVTLSCVSNQVGGNLVGNAKWLGVPLTEVLDRAGVQSGASQIVGRAVDDFTVGFPTDVVYDGRDSMLAIGMNGEPLPLEHGFPARLVVAGLYGYVSATKWLAEIELTTWEAFDAYWVPRGWSKEGPIKTQSRIDTPRQARLTYSGEIAVAGVAWAPDRGISKVEVQIGEDAPWVEAELSSPLSDDSWVQWMVPWDPPLGTTFIQVRATDGDGNTQTEERAEPAPSGATGWDRHAVTIDPA